MWMIHITADTAQICLSVSSTVPSLFDVTQSELLLFPTETCGLRHLIKITEKQLRSFDHPLPFMVSWRVRVLVKSQSLSFYCLIHISRYRSMCPTSLDVLDYVFEHVPRYSLVWEYEGSNPPWRTVVRAPVLLRWEDHLFCHQFSSSVLWIFKDRNCNKQTKKTKNGPKSCRK